MKKKKKRSDNMKTIRLAIIGSRYFVNYELFKRMVDNDISDLNKRGLKVVEIVSGGARGTDTMASKYAMEKHIKILNYLPKDRSEKKSYLERNDRIIERCDIMLSFLVAQLPCTGTRYTTRKCKNNQKEVFEHVVTKAQSGSF